ncbi:MAG: sugar phosphate isomerase/epimerase [Clostridia bacterium]|nr:sugar phosphate isomerase/epimerase [Clostridia bacterium]
MVEYGLQMFSIRDMAAEDLRGALKKVAELGYKYIEFAGFFGNTAEDVKAWLDEYGLICSGTHTHLAELAPEKIDKTIAYHKTIGCDTIIVPGMRFGDAFTLDLQIARLNYAEKILKDNGLRLGYHNHSRELVPNRDGQIVETELLNRTNVEIEVDTFWAFNSGIDALAFLEANKDRISVIHLKDGFPSAAENKNYDDVHTGVKGMALGEGQAPVTVFREWAIKNNVRMVVESEGLNPTGAEEVGRCIKFLRSLD